VSYRYVQAWFDDLGVRPVTKAFVVHMTEGDGTINDVKYLASAAEQRKLGDSSPTAPLRGVSVHYVIYRRPDGSAEIVQMLGETRISGSLNPAELRTSTDPAFTSPDGVRVVYGAATRAPIMGSWVNSGVISCEVAGKAADGPSKAQSAALARLVADVRTRYPGLPVLGHRDFTSTKGCPGHGVLWGSLLGHGRPVAPPQVEEDMGVAVRLAATSLANPLEAFGTAKIKGTGHDLMRQSDGKPAVANVADGFDLGRVQKGWIAAPAPAWAKVDEECVVYNVGAPGQTCISPMRDVVLTPLTAAPAPTPGPTAEEVALAVTAAANAAAKAAAGEVRTAAETAAAKYGA
jgi:hypothetical protein